MLKTTMLMRYCEYTSWVNIYILNSYSCSDFRSDSKLIRCYIVGNIVMAKTELLKLQIK